MAANTHQVKAVIPAAGYGTRLHPFTLVVPKELLPVRRKPMIQMAVEEAIASGIRDIGIVIREGKEVIRDYFDVLKTASSPLNEHYNRELSRAQAELHFVFQRKPQGLGDAIYEAKDFISDSPFVMIIPDQFVISKAPATGRLLDAARENIHAVWSSLVTVPPEELGLFPGARRLELTSTAGNTYKVKNVQEETGYSNGGSFVGFGRTYFPAGVVEFFSDGYLNPATGEVDLLPTFEALVEERENYAVLLEGKAMDLGTWEGYEYFSHFLVRDNNHERDTVEHWMWETN